MRPCPLKGLPTTWCLFLVVTLLVGTSGMPLEAAQLPTSSGSSNGPYAIQTKKELGLFLAGGALIGVSAFLHPHHSCPCSSLDVKGIDRRFAGDSPRLHPARASDVLNIVVVPGTAAILTALDAHRSKSGWTGFGHNGIVLAEAAVLNFGLTEITKKLVSRPRPFTYDLPAGSIELQDDDSFKSFYSGHTSTSFVIGMTYARTYALNHPDGHRRLAYISAIGLASATGILRVAARKHFPTDVLAGAGSGIVIGLLVPKLHR